MSSAAIELKFDRVSKTYHPGETVTGRYVMNDEDNDKDDYH